MTSNLKRHDHVLNLHLQHAWKRACRDNLDPYLMVDRETRIFSLVALMDPTDGRYLTWLASWRRRQWDLLGLGVSCALEQIDEIGEALRLFDRARSSLPADRRDVGGLRTAEELRCAATHGADAVVSARRRLHSEAIAGTEILFEAPPWSLVRLGTESSARWWGEGTRWCTARSTSHFKSYIAKGDLLVLLTPNGRYQFAPASGEFKDAADVDADLHHILRDAPLALARIMRCGPQSSGEPSRITKH